MSTLTGTRIKNTYQSLLKTNDNGLITNTFKNITDGSGSISGLYLKNDGVLISSSFKFVDGSQNTGKILTSDADGNASWQTGSNGGGGWSLTGNAGTVAGINSIGTTDNIDFVIKRNNSQIARFYSNRFFVGINAGTGSTGTENNFLGTNAGSGSGTSYNCNFLGTSAGVGATGVGDSNFFGTFTGFNAASAYQSTFIGREAGYGATNAFRSNFLGHQAGIYSTNASNSNFLGRNAGNNAPNASDSNFLGQNSGGGATSAFSSNFLGGAGSAATNANNSNFFGNFAGGGAVSASYSNFFGPQSGYQATSASYSNFFGFKTGTAFTANNVGSNNIIIGTNISLPNTASNSINIGGVFFGINTYSNTATEPSIVPTATGRIGIRKVTPANTLDIYSENANTSGLRLSRLTSSSPTSTGQAIGVDTNGDVVTIDQNNTVAVTSPYSNPLVTISTDIIANLLPDVELAVPAAQTVVCIFPPSPPIGKIFVVTTGESTFDGYAITYRIAGSTLAPLTTYTYMWADYGWTKLSQVTSQYLYP